MSILTRNPNLPRRPHRERSEAIHAAICGDGGLLRHSPSPDGRFRRPVARQDGLGAFALLAALGFALGWMSATHPGQMPFWAPWDFSAPAFIAASLASGCHIRGLSAHVAVTRPSYLRRIGFFAGVLVIYAVVQTRFEYMAQHMFVLHRIQHLVMHHLGPMLIALSWPGATLKLGAPRFVRSVIENRIITAMVGAIQRPVPAAILFVGLIFFWLIPPIHFRAMIDRNLYWLMNWSMILDGILFWSLVLDPRPSPPARLSFLTRGALAFVVIFPQIVGGAAIAYNHADLYSYYDFCGRLWPWLGALGDQQFGGLVIWIPASMMSAISLLLIIDRYRRTEESISRPHAGRGDVAASADDPVDITGEASEVGAG